MYHIRLKLCNGREVAKWIQGEKHDIKYPNVKEEFVHI